MSGNKKYKNAIYPTRLVTDCKDMLESSARIYADRTAYMYKPVPGGQYKSVSYVQFKEDVDAMGTALISLGLKGKHIGVIGETRYEWMVGDLAVLNGTGVVVPLDKELPEAEIRNLVERSHLSAIIYSAKIEKRLFSAIEGIEGLEYRISMDLRKSNDEILSFSELMEKGRKLIQSGNRSFIDAKIDPDAMSILLFTSGTTGLAKGVMLSHRNIANTMMQLSKHIDMTGSISLSILPIHHTFEFTCNHMSSLYQGVTLAICEGLKYIVKNMNECQATVLVGVPQVFEMMHNRIWKQAEKQGNVKKLKKGLAVAKQLDRFNIKQKRRLFKDVHKAFGGHIDTFIVGAAAMDPEIMEHFNLMGINMFQGYGLTESAPLVALHRDRYHIPAAAGALLPDIEVKIADPDEDGIGEIITRSDSVMLGYYDDPEATAEAIRDGWLYTGDYGYVDKDNFLYITGRKKNVIVTKNGKNIFPEEVEYYLNKSPYIKEVVVLGEEDDKSGDLIVTAHIVPEYEAIEEEAGKLDEEGVRTFLKKTVDDVNDIMSSYKRVKKIVIRKEEFEKTSTKKIKRYGKNVGEE